MKYFFISIGIISILFFGSSPLPLHAQAVEPPPGTFNGGGQPFVEDRGFVPLTGVPGLTDGTEERTLVDYLNVIFRFAIGIGALAAVLRITFAGIMYMTSEASQQNKSRAKEILTNAILGLLLLLSIVVILQVVNEDILDLNFLDGPAQRLQLSSSDVQTEGAENEDPQPKALCQFEGRLIPKSDAAKSCDGDISVPPTGFGNARCVCNSDEPVETVEPTNQEDLTEEEQSFFDAVTADDSNLQLSNSEEVKGVSGDRDVIFSVDRRAHGRAGISPETVETTCEKSGGEFETVGNPPKGFLCLE